MITLQNVVVELLLGMGFDEAFRVSGVRSCLLPPIEKWDQVGGKRQDLTPSRHGGGASALPKPVKRRQGGPLTADAIEAAIAAGRE